MARLAIDKDFLDDYSKLENTVQAAVKAAIDKFGAHTYAGLHLEKITRCKDDRIKTIRNVTVDDETEDRWSFCVLLYPQATSCPATHRLQRMGGWIGERALELSYTAWDFAPFARDLGDNGLLFRCDAPRT